MADTRLKDKVVLVTGASRGVGAALAVELARQGAHVAVAARSIRSSDTRTRVEDVGGKAFEIPVDLTDEEQTESMVTTAAQHFGRLDALVNNAAATGTLTSIATEAAVLHMEMDVNLFAPLVAARAAVPHLRETGGAILNVTSLVGMMVTKNLMMYGVSKLALERLTLDLASQLQKDGIACNAFRIDLPVREQSELEQGGDGIRGRNLAYAEPTEVAAEGLIWMLCQPQSYTGQIESMRFLRDREGVMVSRAKKPFPLRHPVFQTWPVSI